MSCCNPFASAIAARFTQTAEILRTAEQRDRLGGSTGQTIVAHRYKCRVLLDTNPNSPNLVADTSVVRSNWKILMALDSEIKPDDKIRIDGQLYEVLDDDRGRSGASFLTIFCRKTT